jgi:UDP-N-acetylmuramate dehydrogenase
VREQTDAPLADLTTLRLGGPARHLVEVADAEETAAAVEAADRAGEPVLVLAGGSNLVLSDDGFAGTVVLLRSQGVRTRRDGDHVVLTVAAGQDWNGFVARCAGDGLSGIECLSGIPGSAGATPIQNVGAYGQEVAETIVSVTAYDRRRGEVVTLPPEQCGFAYRTSVFKGSDRWVVLEVSYALTPSLRSGPLRFGELTRLLDVAPGGDAPLGDVRTAVLGLRGGKGMVLDEDDRDTWSVGSFFTNPIVDQHGWSELLARVADRVPGGAQPPNWQAEQGRVKTSAAWLIERAGFHRGYGRDGVGISTKHTLALTNRGEGTTKALLALAREVRDGVVETFGVTLVPEPVLVGVSL